MKWLRFKNKDCMGCLTCMTIKEEQVKGVNCRILIDMCRRGGPKFDHEKCAKSNCTKCINLCPGYALYKR